MHHKNVIASLVIVTLSLASLSAAFQIRPTRSPAVQRKIVVVNAAVSKSAQVPAKQSPLFGAENAAAAIMKATGSPALNVDTSLVITPANPIPSAAVTKTSVQNCSDVHCQVGPIGSWTFYGTEGVIHEMVSIPSWAKYMLVSVNGWYVHGAKSVTIDSLVAGGKSTLELPATDAMWIFHHQMISNVMTIQGKQTDFDVKFISNSTGQIIVNSIEIHFAK